MKLLEGMKYFVTVKVCNIAGLCTSVSSDGFVVDSSPPSPGRVLDGVDGNDLAYQASKYDHITFVTQSLLSPILQ